MKIKTAIQYKYRDSLKSALIFFSIITLVLVAMVIGFGLFQSPNSTVYFSGYTFAATIMMFVVGVCSIREDLRLYIQNGIARKTVFVVDIAMAVLSAAAIAVGGEIFMLLGRVFSQSVKGFFVQDFYSLIYAGGSSTLTFFQHVESVIMASSLMLLAFSGGMFFSLIFYRLNKGWSILIAITIPFILLGVLPVMIFRAYAQVSAWVSFMAASSWNLVLVFLAFSSIMLFINWLLTRKIHIRGL
ncbi:MAG: hypothetical protein EOM59_08995 [Clostridia bacterium]|nr:hypothetical protein [Clostridia bacterium]